MNTVEKLTHVLSDPNSLMFHAKKRRKDIIFWIVVIIMIFTVYFLLSEGDYSFILVLSSMIQTFSFILMLFKVYSYKSCSGLSLNSLTCYLIILMSRLSSTIIYNGYLPADTTGDWFYQLTEVISLICCICLIYMITTSHKDTAEMDNDDIKYFYLAIPTLFIALLIHPSLNKNFITDILWAYSMYLESVAIFPQLHLFKKKSGWIEEFTSHYVALQGLSRLFSLVFWYDTFTELNEYSSEGLSLMQSYTGYFVMLSQVIQLLLMIEYYWYYFKSIWKKENINMNDIL
jgi:ER lumen protein retaining receptor